MGCSGNIGIESEKCCTCQPVEGTCPGGYTSGLSSCASGYLKKCLDVSNLECCACFYDEVGHGLPDGRPDGCGNGYAAKMTSSDCPTFDDYNVVFECKGTNDYGEQCCKCKLIPVKRTPNFLDIIEENIVEECPDSYSHQIGTCPIVFGSQTVLRCINEACCRCEIPNMCPDGTIEETQFDPFSCNGGRISCQNNIAGNTKCCSCIFDIPTSFELEPEEEYYDEEEDEEYIDCSHMKEFMFMEEDEFCEHGYSKVCEDNGFCCTCIEWDELPPESYDNLIDIESVRRSIIDELKKEFLAKNVNDIVSENIYQEKKNQNNKRVGQKQQQEKVEDDDDMYEYYYVNENGEEVVIDRGSLDSDDFIDDDEEEEIITTSTNRKRELTQKYGRSNLQSSKTTRSTATKTDNRVREVRDRNYRQKRSSIPARRMEPETPPRRTQARSPTTTEKKKTTKYVYNSNNNKRPSKIDDSLRRTNKKSSTSSTRAASSSTTTTTTTPPPVKKRVENNKAKSRSQYSTRRGRVR